MPIVNLKILGTLTVEQKRELVRRFNKGLRRNKFPEYAPGFTWIWRETSVENRRRSLCLR